MMKTHYLFPGHLIACTEPTVVTTLLGSCVAVALYDPVKKIGGLNHYLLPEPLPFDQLSGRYGTYAIAQLIKEIEKAGADTSKLQAKVYGGAHVIHVTSPSLAIGDKNIAMAEKILNYLRIPIIEKNVGGQSARTLKFHSATFEVIHKLTDDK